MLAVGQVHPTIDLGGAAADRLYTEWKFRDRTTLVESSARRVTVYGFHERIRKNDDDQ